MDHSISDGNFPLIIEFILSYTINGTPSSYRRFYLVRSEISVLSFFSRILHDVTSMIKCNYDQISLYCRGNLMQFSSRINQYSFGKKIIRVFCLVYSLDSRKIVSDIPLSHDNSINTSNIFHHFSENVPQFRNFVESHPEIQSALSSPETNEILNQLIRNPSRLNDFMMRHDQELRNIESLPGGYSALERLYKDIQEPLQNVFEDLVPNSYDDNNQDQLGTSQNPYNAENRRPLDNPWDSIPNLEQYNDFSQGHINVQNSSFIEFCKRIFDNSPSIPSTSGSSPQVDFHPSSDRTQITSNATTNFEQLEQRFSFQMEILLNMGFTDRNRNLEALSLSNGDIELAVNILLTH